MCLLIDVIIISVAEFKNNNNAILGNVLIYKTLGLSLVLMISSFIAPLFSCIFYKLITKTKVQITDKVVPFD